MIQQPTMTRGIHRRRLAQTVTVITTLLVVFGTIGLPISQIIAASSVDAGASVQTTDFSMAILQTDGYPEHGRDLNPDRFALELPPPPLDALPYDIREPLANGTSVPVKKRWLWLPDKTAIAVTTSVTGQPVIDVPVGALWWKEFYVETDRGAFLIERRIISRVAISDRHPQGWAFYTSHAPTSAAAGNPLILPSTGPQADAFLFAASDWLPTQSTTHAVEVRFEDARGVTYPYVFPGQAQCTVCHTGAAGAYPNPAEDPIEVFGLHPNNLTHDSYAALVARGWIVGDDLRLTTDTPQPTSSPTVEALTTELVGVLRNNCASCHNAAPGAAAAFTAFILDPNQDYTADELRALLTTDSRMMGEAGFPLVTPGDLAQSEIWLRLNGLEERRRMPPLEGGLPEPDPRMLELWRQWILAAGP